MGKLDRHAIAQVLREMAAILLFKGENPFKIRAYETAADRLEDVPDHRFEELAVAGRLAELPGVGEAIATKVKTLFETGELLQYQRLRAEYPPRVLELLLVPDLGPRKAATLWRTLGIGSLEQLAEACREGRVRALKGFGERTERKLLEGAAAALRADRLHPLGDVLPVGQRIARQLRAAPGVVRVELAGSVRRWRESVHDLDLVVAAPDAGPVFDHFLSLPGMGPPLARGGTRCTALAFGGLQVDVRVLPEPQFATALHHFTGSKAHHVRLRGLALRRGLSLSEYGVERIADGSRLGIEQEADLYAALELPFVPPELREDTGEIEAALEDRLPRLVELEDLQGYVHLHTRASDGVASIFQMAEAVRARGGRFVAITDHSRAANYAGGLEIDRLRAQWEELESLRERLPGIVLLRGAEVDILEDGRLDYPEEVLAELDVVVASVHSRFQMGEDAMTRRLLAALDNPFLDILGHPTGRMLGRREPYPVRLGEVLEKAAARSVAVEVNGNPRRLDLKAEHARRAIELGVKLVCTTDAHSTEELDNLRYSVATARRAWARREDVLNTLGPDAFLAAIRERRRGASAAARRGPDLREPPAAER